MTGTEHQQHPPDPNHPWIGCSVTCDVCGFRIDLVNNDWRCQYCGAQWPKPDPEMIAKWRAYLGRE